MARIDSKKIRDALKVYFIVGSNNCLKNPLEVVEEAIEGGITIFQFREKGEKALIGQEKYQLAKEIQQVCKTNGILFIVNDDIELAIELDADGIHIGQDDEPIENIREKIGDKILGVSVHSYDEAQLAAACGADYLGLGPIFPTKTKKDAKEVRGTTLIKELRTKGMDIPIVGIGGITVENARSVVDAGADGVAVITAISHAANIKEAAQNLKGNI
ncbi:thiamine phosphate synthase [Neobacillus ginsengisoli]|uniref:Thiamine-phosphate synthase n=1 Tax=Neobacillus ginsengisoli TaxID=904295 RepID=A0ABT9XVU3_9BACI|nr:thiamine phosphate synthase [Neobacillus ginsengisoli]MDQ0199629.1 thiamine-phosphate pyrophosphorylase [Neobacillus ginsengisoli]